MPVLAVFYRPTILAFNLSRSGAGLWRNLWLVDRDIPGVSDNLRVLSRLGAICDVSGLEPDEVASRLAPLGVNGALALDDRDLLAAADLTQRLHLPGHPRETALRLTDKAAQREAFRAAGLAVPGFWTVSVDASRSVWRRATADVRFPVVVKPRSGAGSQFVTTAHGIDELECALDEIARGGKTGAIIETPLADGWVREERPYADFVSVESLVTVAGISHLCVTGRSTLAPPFRETGSFLPALLSTALRDSVVREAERAVTALRPGTGMFHTEVKLTPGGPVVLEVNGRVGGMIPEIAELAGGHRILNVAGRVALGEPLAVRQQWKFNRVGYSLRANAPMAATRLANLVGLDAAGRLPGVDSLLVNKKSGDRIDWRDGYPGSIYVAYGSASNNAEMWDVRQRIQHTVRAEYDFDPDGAPGRQDQALQLSGT